MKLKLTALLLVIILLLPSVNAEAKKQKSEFETRVETMIRVHKAFMEKLLKYIEQTKENIKLLAEVIYWENWWTDPEKEAAWLTGCVVLNRVNSEDWPNTIHDVLYQKGQYSTTKYFFTKELPQECYDMAVDLLKNGTGDVPAGVVFQATFSQGKLYKKINGEYFCYGK